MKKIALFSFRSKVGRGKSDRFLQRKVHREAGGEGEGKKRSARNGRKRRTSSGSLLPHSEKDEVARKERR